MQKIYEYFIISIFVFLSVGNVFSQQQKNDSTAFKLNSLRIETDLVTIVSGISNTGFKPNFEVGIYADINKKFMPALEIGFANKANTNNYGTEFKTNGFFGRAGVDFNLMKKKSTKSTFTNLFYAGLRIGYSPFSFDYYNFRITDGYWNEVIEQDIKDIKYTATWLEFVAGVRVEITRNIFMGWSVRNKRLFGTDIPGELSPYYIPGFGIKGEGKTWGVNYSLGYRF